MAESETVSELLVQTAARALFEIAEVSDDIRGFHVQQAIEKA